MATEIQVVPCTPTGEPSWVQRTNLDGTDYLLAIRWSQRTGGWYLSVLTQDEVPIVQGRRLTPGWPLLKGVNDVNRPPGELMLYDTAEPCNSGATHPRYATVDAITGEDPTFDGLGQRWELLYFPAALFTE